MEYFAVSCLRRGMVSLDGHCQGASMEGESLQVFQCDAGLHDISLECQIGKRCREMTQRVMIAGTNAIVPKVVRFMCDL